MHELSIVVSIVELAESALLDEQASRIAQIDLEIGMLAGVSFEALEFAWPHGVKNTALEQAEKVIHKIVPRLKCIHCKAEFSATEIYTLCPTCGQYGNEVLAGRELRIKSIIVN